MVAMAPGAGRIHAGADRAPAAVFEELGFVDTLDQVSQVNHDSALVKMFVNPYAAIPSMHCAFALMIGVSGALVSRATRSRRSSGASIPSSSSSSSW